MFFGSSSFGKVVKPSVFISSYEYDSHGRSLNSIATGTVKSLKRADRMVKYFTHSSVVGYATTRKSPRGCAVLHTFLSHLLRVNDLWG